MTNESSIDIRQLSFDARFTGFKACLGGVRLERDVVVFSPYLYEIFGASLLLTFNGYLGTA